MVILLHQPPLPPLRFLTTFIAGIESLRGMWVFKLKQWA